MKGKINFIFSVLSILLISFSCKNPDNPQLAPSGNYQNGIWIINEGLYGAGNASLDFYHKDKDTLERNVFENVNGHPLGDVLESVTHWDNKYYLVMNSSFDIVVVDDKNFKLQTVISTNTEPRYMLPINNQKAYLTNETANKITILNPTTNAITGQIPYKPGPDSLGSWTEQMVAYKNDIYVAAVKTGKLLVINSLSDKIIDTINLSVGAVDVAIDKENKIWVLCDGTIAIPNINSKLYCVDPINNSILQQYTFPDIKTGVGKLTFNPNKDSLYYVNGGIYKMGIHQGSLPSKSIVDGNGFTFYGLGIDPDNNTIYAGDAFDFTQNNPVLQYSQTGKLLKIHHDGVGPNGFLFVK